MSIDIDKETHSDEEISAFAFKTGRLIEHIIKVTSNNALERVKELEAKILQYRSSVADVFHEDELKQYDEHFGITEDRQ